MTNDQGESVIAVMGATGSGKTTFINSVSGSTLRVGEGLDSCTSQIQTASLQLDGRPIRLVDTPGFDDNNKSDGDILKLIVEYLTSSYKQGSRLSGVVYMHRISDFRMGGIAVKNFRMFRQLCGDDSLTNVAIVTNMWGEVSKEVGEERETALASKDKFFKPALDKQARILRHHNTLESARNILRQLIRNRPLALRIQQEIVDEHRDISQTGAAEELERELKEKERLLQQEFQRLHEQAEAERAKAEREREEERRKAAAEKERLLQAEMIRAHMEAQIQAAEQERLRGIVEAMRLEAERVEAERQRQARELQEHLQRAAEAARAEQDRINQLAAELQNRPTVVHEDSGCIIC